VLGNSVQNHGQLTDETTNNRHNVSTLSSKTVNINDFLENDALFLLGLLNVFFLNVRAEFGKLLSTSSSLSVPLALGLSLDALLLLLLGLFLSIITLLVVCLNSGLVS